MGGGIGWDVAWQVSFDDREIMIKQINKKLKAQNPDGREYM
jgi:hypothetical protein